MGNIRMIGAYLASVVVAFVLASIFYTQQVLAKQAAIGAVYSREQQIATYTDNLIGLAPAYGVVLALALLIGFIVAAGVKRVLKPLAPIAYPTAGAAAVFTALWMIENVGPLSGVGAIGGARDAFGIALQCAAGFAGGVVFALTRGASRS